MTEQQLVVLGGTGKTGRRVASRLRELGLDPRVASRSGSTRFDWTDETTWEPALKGADALYIVLDDERPDLTEPLVQRAVAAGVRRLVLLSARAWADLGDDTMLAGERAVRSAGVNWTILRPTWFAQNFAETPFISDAVRAGELVLPVGDGREPFVDLDDLAEVAAAALLDDRHAGQTYELSGPRALTWAEAVTEVARASGRTLRYVAVDPQQYAVHLTGRGYPAEVVAVLDPLYAHIRDGLSAHLSDGVQQALGRGPRDFATYVRDAAAAGAWRD
ncbi:NAD(P)H-binding protein [Jiangella gansuensis]|uniref:NAD(P)H-binding protein n=1 Tax=Jiangella gansuensis TaxID=281473 RepID=UPI000479525E|nr:NAD(P)H-binding protein [Jiangella gansuensis]